VKRLPAPRARAWLACLALVACAPGPAASPASGPGALLVVGTSGDYAPFSRATGSGPADVDGFDLEIARAFARDEGLALELVRFRWPELAGDLASGRFAMAMGGVTVRPERSVHGRFGVPVAESGAVVLAWPDVAADLGALDRPGIRIAVNRGGHLERVARERFPAAEVVALVPNDEVPRALRSRAVDALVSDTLEAPHWQRTLPGSVRLGPFTRDRKAYLWLSAEAERAERMDAWLMAREADGSLARWRERWLGGPGPPTATPFAALLAAVGERLALMPLVAEAKRASGAPLRDPGQEARVVEAAWGDVVRRAAEAGVPPPERPALEAFQRAQIEAAVALQRAVLARPAAQAGPAFDLETELRPALQRIGERMAFALVRLRGIPEPEALHAALAAELAPHGLGAPHLEALSAALRALARPAQERVNARASRPATTGSASDTP
jgi:cyclohexadienyl dehydratase